MTNTVTAVSFLHAQKPLLLQE